MCKSSVNIKLFYKCKYNFLILPVILKIMLVIAQCFLFQIAKDKIEIFTFPSSWCMLVMCDNPLLNIFAVCIFLPSPRSSKFSSVFCRSFIVLALTFRFMNVLPQSNDLNTFLHIDILLSEHHLLKRLSFLLELP